jgi:non-ribosomal peptide synthetase component E (peptide arylation enzyme)
MIASKRVPEGGRGLGEAVVAVVVAAAAPIDPEALRRATRASLAGYKVPKAVRFVDALPRNAMGKVDKGEIRRALSTGTNGS